MAKDKWKTFPCKNCIIKNTCSKACFEYPDVEVVRNFSLTILDECIACGVKDMNNENVWCHTCFIKHGIGLMTKENIYGKR